MRALRDICEFQAEVCGIARIVVVRFVSAFKIVRYGRAIMSICVNVKLNLVMLCRNQ